MAACLIPSRVSQRVDPLFPHRRSAGLASGEAEVHRLRLRPAQRMHLGTQPAARAANGVVALFVVAPAACWGAGSTVESSKTLWRSIRFRRVRPIRIGHHTPRSTPRCQRMEMVCHAPYAGGKSRHGVPVRRIALYPFQRLTMPESWRGAGLRTLLFRQIIEAIGGALLHRCCYRDNRCDIP